MTKFLTTLTILSVATFLLFGTLSFADGLACRISCSGKVDWDGINESLADYQLKKHSSSWCNPICHDREICVVDSKGGVRIEADEFLYPLLAYIQPSAVCTVTFLSDK